MFLLKLLTQALPIDFAAQLPLKPILLVMSSAAILGGSLLALKQTDIKRMLAYSTAAQVGYHFSWCRPHERELFDGIGVSYSPTMRSSRACSSWLLALS